MTGTNKPVEQKAGWSMRVRAYCYRALVLPVLGLLARGMSPRKLAWSLAVGLLVGINPLLGSTTVLCLLVAAVLRLNLVASQLTNHIVYPLQLALLFVFLRAGSSLFHTPALPLARAELVAAVRLHPWDTTRLLWRWEWHALVVWLVLAVVVTPVLAIAIQPLLERALLRIKGLPAA